MNEDNNTQIQTSHEKLSTVVLYAVIFGLILVFGAAIANNKYNHIKVDEVKTKVVEKDYFKDVEITAKAAYVYDVKNRKVLYSKNSDEALPLASLTKVMMAITAYELVPSYSTVSINKEFLEEDGDTGLLPDEKWKFSDLLNFSLIVSSNDGARAIASAAGALLTTTKDSRVIRSDFVRRMNQKAQEIGLHKTRFENENGLDTKQKTSGAEGSAQDVSKLFEYIIKTHPELLEATRYGTKKINSLDNVVHVAKNTNSSVESIPGVIASKTGFTDLAGGNLVVVMEPGLEGPYIVSVLGSTYDDRFKDVSQLSDAILKHATRK